MASKGDWDFGQKVVELDYATLDRVRECIAVQEKIHDMGGSPRTLADIMREKGYLTRGQIEAVLKLLADDRQKTTHHPPTQVHPPPHAQPSTHVHAPQTTHRHAPAPFTQTHVGGQSQQTHTQTHHVVAEAPRPHRRRLLLRRRETPSGINSYTALLFVLFGVVALMFYYSDELGISEAETLEETPSDVAHPVPAFDAAHARRELDAIVAAQAADQGKYAAIDRIMDRYVVYLGKYQGTPAAKDGEGRRKAYIGEIAKAGENLLSSIKTKAGEPLGRGALGEVVGLYRQFPSTLLDRSAAGKSVRQELARLTDEIDERYHLDKARFDRVLAAGNDREALGIIEGILLYIDPDHRAEVERLRAEILERQERSEGLKNDELRDDIVLLGCGIKRALGERDAGAALRQIDRFLAKRGADETARLLEMPSGDGLTTLLCLERREYEKASASIGATLRSGAGGATDLFLDIRDVLLLDVAFRSFKDDDLRRMSVGDVARRMETVLKAGDGSSHLALALLWYYAPSPESQRMAIPHFERARSLDVPGVERYLQALTSDLTKLRSERIERELAAARRAAERREWEIVEETLEGLLRSPVDRPMLGSVKDVEEMRDIGRRQAKRVKDLRAETLAGVRDLGGGLYRFAYDFASEAQLGAFQSLKGAKSTWVVRNGLLEGNGSPAMMWKRAAAGDIEVEFDLFPLDPRNVALNICYRPESDTRYYACVFGMDLLEGDVERKQGLPVNGVYKYPVNVDFNRWLMPSFWDEWKRRAVGHAVREVTLQAGGRYRIAVERKGEAVRMKVDGSPIWEGSDAEYTGGHAVLSLSKSHARIDNLVFIVKVP